MEADGWRADAALMDAESAAKNIESNKFLCGLLSRFSAEAIETAAMEVNGFPASMVDRMAEALLIQQYLEKQGR